MSERRAVGLWAGSLLLVAGAVTWAVSTRPSTIGLSAYTQSVRFEGFALDVQPGRRSAANELRVRFDRPLPRRFTLRATGRAAAAYAGKDVAISLPGGSRQVVRFQTTESTLDVSLENPWLASALDWSLPDTTLDGSAGRAVIELSRLEVLP